MVMAQARPFLIAGGGIGGLAAALGLAQKSFARFCSSPSAVPAKRALASATTTCL